MFMKEAAQSQLLGELEWSWRESSNKKSTAGLLGKRENSKGKTVLAGPEIQQLEIWE